MKPSEEIDQILEAIVAEAMKQRAESDRAATDDFFRKITGTTEKHEAEVLRQAPGPEPGPSIPVNRDHDFCPHCTGPVNPPPGDTGQKL